MAASNTPTPTAAADVTAILDADLVQVFERARMIRAEVLPESKVMEHPLEDGASVVDHRIILPVVINLSMVLASQDYAAVYNQIRDFFLRAELLTVQTRIGSFSNMLIEKMPHDENADIVDGVLLAVTLKEAQFAEAQFVQLKVARPRDSNTVKRGEQQPQTSPPQRGGSVLSRVF